MPERGSRTSDPLPDPGHRAIWAPWRLPYLEQLGDHPAGDQARTPGVPASGSVGASFLSDYWAHPDDDERNFVVRRNPHGMILLNAYPYANGHLLVALGEPRPALLDYRPEDRAELWSLVEDAADLMHRTLEPQGINIGINQGLAAGAGVPGHLHVHLVPRWSGDTNFVTVVGAIRVIPCALEAMYERYAAAARAS